MLDVLTLIAITDDLRDGITGLAARTAAAVRGGATMVQLRLKHADARTLLAAARELLATLPATVPLIINDRVDVALAAGAAGVHVGADDVSVAMVRRTTPPGFIVGTSVGAPSEIANAALADYAGIGPIYATPSKSDAGNAIGIEGFEQLARQLRCPVVAIGGITETALPALATTSAAGIAVISAIFGSADPERAAHQLCSAFVHARMPLPRGAAPFINNS